MGSSLISFILGYLICVYVSVSWKFFRDFTGRCSRLQCKCFREGRRSDEIVTISNSAQSQSRDFGTPLVSARRGKL